MALTEQQRKWMMKKADEIRGKYNPQNMMIKDFDALYNDLTNIYILSKKNSDIAEWCLCILKQYDLIYQEQQMSLGKYKKTKKPKRIISGKDIIVKLY